MYLVGDFRYKSGMGVAYKHIAAGNEMKENNGYDKGNDRHENTKAGVH